MCPQTLVPKFPRGRRVETEPALPMEKQGDRGAAHLSFNPGCGFRPHKGALPLRDFSQQGRKKKIGTQHPRCKPLDFKLGLLAFHCVDSALCLPSTASQRSTPNSGADLRGYGLKKKLTVEFNPHGDLLRGGTIKRCLGSHPHGVGLIHETGG